MKYKVHITFITSDNRVIKPGIYEDTEFDLAEARKKSIVTTVHASSPIESSTENVVRETKMTTPETVQVKNFSPEVKVLKINKLKINSASQDELEAYKFVGRKTAEKVIEERTKSKFKHYIDLDKRVPVKGVASWEDIAPIDFEPTNPITFNNSIKVF